MWDSGLTVHNIYFNVGLREAEAYCDGGFVSVKLVFFMLILRFLFCLSFLNVGELQQIKFVRSFWKIFSLLAEKIYNSESSMQADG